LQAALNAAQAGEPEEKVIAHIEKASPELAAATKKAVIKGGYGVFTTILLAAMVAQCSSLHSTLDVNQLVDQLVVYATEREPYPDLRQKESASPSGEQAAPNRQQRRLQERQSRRQKQPSEQKSPQKPEKK
jgi:hypothetical protein